MSCAIVVLNFNDADITKDYISTIKDYKIYDHIIVVDNASTDGCTDDLKDYCNQMGVDFIASSDNKGYSSGNNKGAFYAIEKYSPDYIFISNPDIICSESSVKKILDGFSISSNIGLVTGLIHVFDEQRNTIPYKYFAYKVPELKDMLSNCMLLLTKFKMDILKQSMYYNAEDVIRKGHIVVGAVSGCFFAIRSDVSMEIKGLDEDIFLYNEEAVLGFNLRKHGYKEVVVNAPVIHNEKQNKHKGFSKQWNTNKRVQESALIYLEKYINASPLTCGVFIMLNKLGFIERYLFSILKQLKRFR